MENIGDFGDYSGYLETVGEDLRILETTIEDDWILLEIIGTIGDCLRLLKTIADY